MKIRIHDLSTNEIIDRDLTAEEIATAAQLAEESATTFAQAAAKEAARISRRAKLLALGLTEDELDA